MMDDVAPLFRALGYPTRLQLLTELRDPKGIQDLDVTPGPSGGAGRPDRTLTRQGIRHHLNQLAETGLVTIERTSRDDHVSNVYRVSQAGLFRAAQILQELATVGEVRSAPGVNGHRLSPETDEDRPPWIKQTMAHRGPRLVLVHGVGQGTTFPLDFEKSDGVRGWLIGSAPSVEISLPHDPYAADKHAEIFRDDDVFRVLDMRSSDRPTYVDWEPLDIGGAGELKPGTVIGIGRSLLVFQDG